MPTLEEATRVPEEGTFERIPITVFPATPPPFVNQDTLYSIRSNVYLRCPAPPINVSPDNLRQYYRGGQVPQTRVFSPPTLTEQATNGGGGTTITNIVSSSVTSTTGSSPTVKTVGLVTPSLNINQVYTTIVQIAKVFTVINVGVNASSRIEMYKTAAQQAADLTRPVTQPVPIGTRHGVICDLSLVSSGELSWLDSPDFIGSNGDNPQTSSIYLTVTNLGAAPAAVSVTINFVPMAS